MDPKGRMKLEKLRGKLSKELGTAERREPAPFKGVEGRAHVPLPAARAGAIGGFFGVADRPSSGLGITATQSPGSFDLSAMTDEELRASLSDPRPAFRGEVELFGPTESVEYAPISSYLKKKKGAQ